MYENYEDYIREMEAGKEMTTKSDNEEESIREDVKKSLQNIFIYMIGRAGYSHDESIKEMIWAFDSMTDNVGHYNFASVFIQEKLEKERDELAEWWKVPAETIENMMWDWLEPLWRETVWDYEREVG